MSLQYCVIASFFVSVVLSVDTSFACTPRTNKHIAQNLDNPNWNSEDPYCGYKSKYADIRGAEAGSNEKIKYSWNVMNKGLLDANSWNNKWCGMCLKVTKYGQTAPAPYVISKLVDYPTKYDMELQIDTYESLNLDMDADTDYVDVVPIVCPINDLLTHSYLHYEFGEANSYYFDVVIWDHIVPIDSVSVKGLDVSWQYSQNNGWKPIARSTWNEFETNNLPQLKPPWQLKITSIFGEVVIDEFPLKPNDYQNTFTESINKIQFTDIGCMETLTIDPTTGSPTLSPITTQPTQTPITKQPTESPVPKPTASPTTGSPTLSPITTQPTQTPITKQPTDSPIPTPTAAPNTKSPTSECQTGWNILPPITVESSINEDSRDSTSWFCQLNPINAVNTDVSLLWAGLSGVYNEFIASLTDDILCGMCLKITKDDKTKIIKVATSGSSHELELFEPTFEAMGGIIKDGLSDGITAEPIACPIDNIQTRNTFHYQFGSSAGIWWFSVVIWDHIVPIKSVFVRRSDNDIWLETKRKNNDFELSWGDNKMEGVLKLKIISIFDEEVFDEIINYDRNIKRTFVEGTAQFTYTGCDENQNTHEPNDLTSTNGVTITTTDVCEEADDVRFKRRYIKSGEVCDICFCDEENVETCLELIDDLSDKKKNRFMNKCNFNDGICTFEDVNFMGIDGEECTCNSFICQKSGANILGMFVGFGFIVIVFGWM